MSQSKYGWHTVIDSQGPRTVGLSQGVSFPAYPRDYCSSFPTTALRSLSVLTALSESMSLHPVSSVFCPGGSARRLVQEPLGTVLEPVCPFIWTQHIPASFCSLEKAQATLFRSGMAHFSVSTDRISTKNDNGGRSGGPKLSNFHIRRCSSQKPSGSQVVGPLTHKPELCPLV